MSGPSAVVVILLRSRLLFSDAGVKIAAIFGPGAVSRARPPLRGPLLRPVSTAPFFASLSVHGLHFTVLLCAVEYCAIPRDYLSDTPYCALWGLAN